ncbi:MAG: lipopolysaccharide biosynthesis protein, partial [Candidatus Omnitrophica bacterium]|nr:lipopolysaccharide biosynthesis protein [Candidatus Omnitrophota bacterium]
MSLKHKTAQSTKWVMFYSVAQRIISFCTTIVLARILDPEVFGMYALAFVVIDGFGLFKSLGIDAALIQRKDDADEAANTAFYIIPFFGIVIYFVLTVSSPYIAEFMGDPEIVPVLRALGLIFVLNAFQRVPLVMLEKDLKFGWLSMSGIAIDILYSVLAITFSILGWRVWSLVVAFLIKTIFGVSIVWVISRWKPNFRFSWALAKDMFHFGKFVFMSSLIAFSISSFDKIVIPKFIDMATLGLYTIAYNFSTIVSSYLGGRINRVLYPVYSRMQDDLHDLRRNYLKVLKLLTLISFPVSVGILLVGGEFLELAYGAKWVGAIPILKILAWLGFLHTVGSTGGPIINALKKPKINFMIDGVKALIIFGGMIPAVKFFGIKGIAYVVLFNSAVAVALSQFVVTRLIKLRYIHILASLRPAAFAALGMT